MSQSPTSLRRGWTLLECLVAIALVATVAALLIPAIQSIRQRGHATANAMRMHDLLVAMMRCHDSHGRFPRSFTGSARAQENWTLAALESSGVTLPPFDPGKPLAAEVNLEAASHYAPVLLQSFDHHPPYPVRTDEDADKVVMLPTCDFAFAHGLLGKRLGNGDGNRPVMLFLPGAAPWTFAPDFSSLVPADAPDGWMLSFVDGSVRVLTSPIEIE